MYDAVADPYCYADTTVLINRLGLRDQAALDEFEAEITRARADEPLPAGRLSVTHYRAIHHHLFQDLYRWAGQFRTVRIAKDGSMFCFPEHIGSEMAKLFDGLRLNRFLQDLDSETFADRASIFLADLNAIHPFREGNGRAQLAFFVVLADGAGHPLALERMSASAFLSAMVESFKGDSGPLRRLIRQLIDN
uniref:protein adenylyltransferase n=1 Tax=Rhodopseudomonas palustris (strain BisA53) TaxID=316055 RepID=Q07TS8_RHOP5